MPSKLYGDIEALKRTAYFLDVIGVTVYSKGLLPRGDERDSVL